ncbi:MAG: helix-turn-helix transcriptional regulator [Lentisphaeria bacterium]|nr:helix-turn-helix transcriptional regulator [Lentisphaeria bacterium]
MIDLPGKVELLGVCYFPSIGKKVIPNIVPKDVFYIEIVLDGELLYGDWNEQQICRRGTMFWHQENDETVWRRTAPDKEFTSFAIRFRLLEPWDRPGHIGRWNNLDELDEFVLDAMRRTFDPAVDRRLLGSYLIHRLLWEFYASTLPQESGELPLPLAKAMSLMQNDDIAAVGIPRLAELAGVSEAHLHALFRKHLGSTPHKYLLRLRMKKARILLAGSTQPVKEVGARCGFQSLESFYRVFRAETGLTPVQFRRRNTALLQADALQHHISVEV